MACCTWPSAAATSLRDTTKAASTSATWRRAVSTAASCFVLSSLKMGWPFRTSALWPTKISLTRPLPSGTIGTVRKNDVTLVVAGWW